MRRDRLRVVGREIWFGDRVVGTLAGELWPTLVDAVTAAVDSICIAEATVPLRDHEDRIEELLVQIDRLHGELELRAAEPADDMDFLR